MKLVTVKLIVMAVLALFTITEASYAEEAKLLEKRVRAWVASYNSNDLKTMMEFYEDSETMNILVSSGTWNKGKTAYKQLLVEDFKQIRFSDSQLENLSVRDFGEFGVVAFTHKFKFKVLNENIKVQVHIRTTMTLRKTEKKWKIIQEHSSPIRGIKRHVLIK